MFYSIIIVRVYINRTVMIMTQLSDKLQKEIAEIQHQIAGYVDKIDVQNKRIKFLKKENQQLKNRQQDNSITSQEVYQQNTMLKKKNRQLKAKLNQIKKIIQVTKTGHVLQTTTIKDVVVTHKTEQLDLPKSDITDQELESLRSFVNIRTLILAENQITDVGCNLICENLVNLRKIFINGNSKITGQGLRNIGKLTHLRCLDLRLNQIGDLGMKYIGKLTDLTQLSVSNNEVTDQGMFFIQNLTNLVYLDLTSNRITSKGASIITKLKSVTNLYLSHNKICSDVGIKLTELPDIKVLDLRFNDIKKQEKPQIKQKSNPSIQLFL